MNVETRLRISAEVKSALSLINEALLEGRTNVTTEVIKPKDGEDIDSKSVAKEVYRHLKSLGFSVELGWDTVGQDGIQYPELTISMPQKIGFWGCIKNIFMIK
nr:MAG TPA: hypothetical protein [Caudoviricetes sp.]